MKITKQSRNWLRHFAEGNENLPKGMGPVGITNFVTHKLIVRMENFEDFGEPRYRLTPKGLALYQESNPS